MNIKEIIFSFKCIDTSDIRYAVGRRWKPVTAAALILAAGALGWRAWPAGADDGSRVARETWVSESTLKVVSGRPGDIAPITRDGDTFVVGVYFGTGGNRKLGYLKKYDERTRLAIEAARKAGDTLALIAAEKNALLRLPTPGSPWVRADSADGMKVASANPLGKGVSNVPAIASGQD